MIIIILIKIDTHTDMQRYSYFSFIKVVELRTSARFMYVILAQHKNFSIDIDIQSNWFTKSA